MPNYKNPPIQEALIDFRFSLAVKDGVPAIEGYAASLAEAFPEKTLKRSMQVQFSQETGEVQQRNAVEGVVLKNAKTNKVLQLDKSGMTFSRLSGYDGWDSFLAEAVAAIEGYSALYPQEALVSRLGVRYINSIKLPLTKSVQLSEHFNTLPILSPKLADLPKELFMRTVFPGKECTCIVTMATDPKTSTATSLAIIFDIDVFIEGPEMAVTDIDSITSKLTTLRDAKNNIFEESLTQATKDLFK